MPAFPRRVLGLAVLAGAWVVRQPLWLVQSFIWMVGMFVAFLAWGGMRALTNLLAAYMVAGMWSVGLNIIAQHVGWDRVGKYYEMFVASSITLPQYLCGVVLSALPFASLSVLPAALLLVYGRAASLPYLLLLSGLALAMGAALGMVVVVRLRDPVNISAITNPLVTLTNVLPPVYYPVSALPEWLRLPSLAVPTVSLMELARWSLGMGCEDPRISAAVVLGWALALLVAVVRAVRWGLED